VNPLHQPSLTSRGLVVGWCAWLLISWVLNLIIDGPTSITGPSGERLVEADGFVPSVRGLLESMAFGLLLVWPAWRLSEPDGRWPGRRVIADLVPLLLVIQVVLWPLRLVMPWSITQTALIDATLAAWAAAAAMCVWVGLLVDTGAARAAAMLAAAIMPTIGWVITAITRETFGASWSPFYQLWMLASANPAMRAGVLGWRLGVLAMLVGMAWMVVMVTIAPTLAGRGIVLDLEHEDRPADEAAADGPSGSQ
jgi:hypothetical protein